jgi:diguanylate cyclase (GGDEF)-like protein
MNLFLDMKTVLTLLAVGHVFTVLLLTAYWKNHPKERTLNVFFTAKCVQGVAWMLLVLRGGIPDVFTISVSNSLLFVSGALETIAVLLLLNAFTRRLKITYIGLVTAWILLFHLVILLHNEESLRIAVASVGTASFVIPPIYRIARDKGSSMLARIIGLLYGIVLITLVGRAIMAVDSQEPMGLFTPGLFQTLSFLSLYLVMIIGNTGFVLLLKERVDRELLQAAHYDELTGTFNRRKLIQRAKLSIAQQAASRSTVTMALFDIDHFKTINDTYGHDAGDRVLKELSQRIRSTLIDGELFGRYGGDEFAMFFSGFSEAETDLRLEQIRVMAEELVVEQVPRPFTISAGIITIFPETDTELQTIYKRCDEALYAAKRNGRNAVVRTSAAVFNPTK